jgi:hypothetical protein
MRIDLVQATPANTVTNARHANGGVAPVAICWRGFLVRRSEVALGGAFHWARVPLPGGHTYDLAGWEPLPGVLSEAWVLQLLGAHPRFRREAAARRLRRALPVHGQGPQSW